MAVAAIATLLLRSASVLLFLLRGGPQNGFSGIRVGQSEGFDESDCRGGPALPLPRIYVHGGPRLLHRQMFRSGKRRIVDRRQEIGGLGNDRCR